MSFYGSNNQGNGPPAPGQRGGVQGHNMQQNQSGGVDVLQSQLFNFNPSQLQFQPGTHNISFSDPNNPSVQMQNIQLAAAAAGAPQLLLQQQQQPNFSNLNVNFLTDQIGVGQILQQQQQQAPPGSQAQSISVQNLITPMSMALGGGVNFTQSASIQAQSATSQASQQAKQRVFTGTVTKTHDNFGFIDEEVFFQMSVVKGVVLPKAGDRVLVEADFNPAMPFKWNATRVQIVNIGGLNNSLPNMNLNPGGKSQSPQPMAHGGQGGSMLSQHGNTTSAASLLGMNFNQNQKNSQSGPQNTQQQGLNSSGHSQVGPPQSQAGNPRYQSSTNPVSIVSNPHSAYGVRNNSARPDDNSRGHPRPQRGARPPPPPGSAPPPPMVSLSAMDPHNVQHLQLPLPLQLPLSVPLQLPSLLQLDRDAEKMDRERDLRERERDREREIRLEKEHDRRERERGRERSLEREKEREKERERDYERKRERERERERDKQKRAKVDDAKRDRDKDKDRHKEKRESPARSIRNRSPIQLIRENRKRSRSRSKGRDKDKEVRDRSKSRSVSPKRTPVVLRDRPTPRYGWELPRTSLDMADVSVMELKRRYRNLYIPSDFILARCSWQETFPLHNPMELTHACPIHIFRRHSEKIELKEVSLKSKPQGLESDTNPAVLNPPDENETLKVKVILLSLPNKATLYRKACGLAEEASDSSLQHPNRLINFVVGTKMAKNETMIIGGSWSPSLDGPNPESDPQVLINTAIRTTKALTGVDLQRCTKWFRFMELYYRRGNGHVETVIVLLPNIWTALPSRRDWEEIHKAYKQAFTAGSATSATVSDNKSSKEDKEESPAVPSSCPDLPRHSQDNSSSVSTAPKLEEAPQGQGGEGSVGKNSCLVNPVKSEESEEDGKTKLGNSLNSEQNLKKKQDDDDIYGDLLPATELAKIMDEDFNDADLDSKMEFDEPEIPSLELAVGRVADQVSSNEDAVTEEMGALDNACGSERNDGGRAAELDQAPPVLVEEGKGTHFSRLDPKHMTVHKLREEMELRGASTKGLKKNQLVTRLSKILKTEESSESSNKSQNENPDGDEPEEDDFVNKTEMASTSADEIVDSLASVNGEPPPIAPEADSGNAVVESNSQQEGQIVSGASSKVVDGNLGRKSTVEESSLDDSEAVNEEKGNKETQPQNQLSRLKKAGITYLVPVLPEGTNEKTRKVWERRYALPKSPNLLVHPSQEAKSGIFDCNQHSLNTLRDYRLADNKEQSFEVSLCSEFFNEMLQRDFAFRIYRELVCQASIEEREEKPGSTATSVVSKEESPTKKRKVSTSSSVTGGNGATTKSKTVDPHLLLAFVFFDHTRCGYITDSDLEDLCLSLGLGLSRSQVRKLVQKVCTKGSLHYRKWTDITTEDGVVCAEPVPRDDTNGSSLLALGNRLSLPIFGKMKQLSDIQELGISSDESERLSKETQSLLAACDADPSLVDIKKLRDQLEKNEKERMALDGNIKLLKSSLNETKAQATELKKVNGGLKEELLRAKESVKKFETIECSAMNDLEILKKASERFLDRVKDLVKLPTLAGVASKEKDSKFIVPKKEQLEAENDNSSMEC